MQVQIPSPFTDHIFIPDEPKKEVKSKKESKKVGALKNLILSSKAGLTTDELKDLTPLELKKYKTRSMLNEILSSKDVKRKTVSPWIALQKSSEVNKIVKIQTSGLNTLNLEAKDNSNDDD